MKVVKLNKYTLEIHLKFFLNLFSHFLYTKMVVKHKSSKSRSVCAVDEILKMDHLKQKNQTGFWFSMLMAKAHIIHGKKSMGAITILRLTRRNRTENKTAAI